MNSNVSDQSEYASIEVKPKPSFTKILAKAEQYDEQYNFKKNKAVIEREKLSIEKSPIRKTKSNKAKVEKKASPT